jgi:hypothetical protein
MRTLIDESPGPSASRTATIARPPADADVRPRPDAHPLIRRLGERFALIGFALYHLPLFINNYPSLGGGGMREGGLAISWGHVFTPPGIWVAHHVFHIAGAMPNGYRGDNGDVAEEFGRLLIAAVIAAAGAIGWTWADRRRPGARWTSEALKLLLRFSIALGLTSYAIAKIFPVQFGTGTIDALGLEQRLGEMRPMALLWSFMMYSRPYAFFGGLMELVVVVLLCFRRTATLGAVLCLAVMTNVAIMNYAYGVPVKLYSTMIVLSAAMLLLYDARRLWAVFITNDSVPRVERPAFYHRIPRWLQWTTKGALVGSVFASSIAAMKPSGEDRAKPSVSAAGTAEGAWRVTAFEMDRRGATASGAPSPWLRVFVRPGMVAVRLATDSLLYCRRTPSAPTLSFTCAGAHRGDLQWSRAGDVLQLAGTIDSLPVRVTAVALHPSDYALLRWRFRWIDEP